MKKEKTITESLQELFMIASEFVEIMKINNIKSHFIISGVQEGSPVTSELSIRFYQPSDTNIYCLIEKYTSIQIGGVTFGEYGNIRYKMSETPESIAEKVNTAKKVLKEFKTYSFGAVYERSLLEIENKIRANKIEIRMAEKQKKLLIEQINSYKR